MDSTVAGALIGAGAAVGGVILTLTGTLGGEALRLRREQTREQGQRVHDQRERRYAERKEAYEEFFRVLTVAERECLEMENIVGVLPGDQGYDEEYKALDAALASLQFVASDDCLAKAEACSQAFYHWAYRGDSHAALYHAMNEFVAAVRTDIDVNASDYVRPIPEPRALEAPDSGDT